jgi:hypothetical protein
MCTARVVEAHRWGWQHVLAGGDQVLLVVPQPATCCAVLRVASSRQQHVGVLYEFGGGRVGDLRKQQLEHASRCGCPRANHSTGLETIGHCPPSPPGPLLHNALAASHHPPSPGRPPHPLGR